MAHEFRTPPRKRKQSFSKLVDGYLATTIGSPEAREALDNLLATRGK